MYLFSKLQDLKNPIRVAFIGCGKFVSMFLAQYNQLDKIIIDTIVELDTDRAKKNCAKSGLTKETCLLYTSPSPRDRQKSRMPSSA